jgi:hypothetical protein
MERAGEAKIWLKCAVPCKDEGAFQMDSGLNAERYHRTTGRRGDLLIFGSGPH